MFVELLNNVYTVLAPTILLSMIISPFIFERYLFSKVPVESSKAEEIIINATFDVSDNVIIKTNKDKTRIRVSIKCCDIEQMYKHINTINTIIANES